MEMWSIFVCLFVVVPVLASEVVPPYIKQCYEGDTEVLQCFKKAIHHLRPYLEKGIKEIELPSVEPFKMDELSLSLTTGPNGYKISLKNIDVLGASKFTVKSLRLATETQPFEARIHIPFLKINSRYESSGVLIILPASGNGTFNGLLEDVLATVRGTSSINERDGSKYLHIDTLKVELDVKNLGLEVKNIFKNNVVLTQAINLFLRENGKEVFHIMLPQLKQKLGVLFMDIANALLSHVPVTTFYVPKKDVIAAYCKSNDTHLHFFVKNCFKFLSTNMNYWSFFCALFAVLCFAEAENYYFIKKCYKEDKNLNMCLRQSTNFLIANLRRGIPELDIYDPEPILIDQIQLALGTGPDGYRAIFRDIEAFGVSNLTVTAVRSDIETNQYQFTMYIPKITAKARYESSGVLILVQASGGGNYWGEYEGVKIKVYLKGSPRVINDKTYLIVQQMKMDFSVKDIKMGVDGIHNGNTVLQAALNLFINSNSQELLKEMKPHLKKKLLILMRNFADKVFSQVPYEAFIA
ncbi:uncharacterized protein LOC126880624 [Diabrotica virgifera virgifera]|uniref:Protein takeout-like n=2 Tax=Diabrotica virgifera virgifera TaxID=50390 RepID=A0ABM5JRM5_DIAVI|nr:uncharacterized protein LOC126880624 [Diabrotica virgifera virgifera]